MTTAKQDSPPVRFTIFAAARTGSNLLCGLLNSHPQILCHHGLFNEKGIHYAIDHRDGSIDLGSPENRDRSPAQFLNRVWENRAGKRVVGFKLQREEHKTAEELLVRDRGIRKILLSRRNRIKAYVSVLIAEQSGLWESYFRFDTPGCPVRVCVDPEALWKYVKTIGTFYAQLEQTLTTLGQPFCSVEYESLTCPAELRRVLRFLDVLPSDLSLRAPSFKRSCRDLCEVIVNFSELKAALRGSVLEGDLDGSDSPQISEVPLGTARDMGGAAFEGGQYL